MKKLILSLFVSLVGIINFGYCDYLNGLQFITNITFNGDQLYVTTPRQLGFPTDEGLLCFNINDFGGNNRLVISRNGNTVPNYRYLTDLSFTIKLFGCFKKSAGTDDLTIYIGSEYLGPIQFFDIDFYYIPTSNYNIVSGNPGYTSLQCQTEYNLIPISSIDTNYCVGNGFCPTNECTGGTSSGTNWSALYINNIQHPGKSIINVSIPDYIFWDYSTTDEEFDLYVGSGYDEDYINSVININSYRPDSSDFTNIFVSGLTLIFPYIVITLFIVFVWKLLKRIFK